MYKDKDKVVVLNLNLRSRMDLLNIKMRLNNKDLVLYELKVYSLNIEKAKNKEIKVDSLKILGLHAWGICRKFSREFIQIDARKQDLSIFLVISIYLARRCLDMAVL